MFNELISRRKFLRYMGLAGGVAVSGYASLIEAKRPLLTRQSFSSPGADPDCRIRIVQLSDLHLRGIGQLEQETAAIVNGLKPDLIVITGDSCISSNRLKYVAQFFAMLDSTVPLYGVTGNWEYNGIVDLKELGRLFRLHQGRLLNSETVSIVHDGAKILLTGLDDNFDLYPDLGSAMHGVSPAANHLILAHQPKLFNMIQGQLAGLKGFHPQWMLAGHTHGGQITFFGLAPHLPRGSGRYKYGWYEVNDMKMFVTRGIGTTMIPARLMAPPEVVCFDWNLRRENGPLQQQGGK